VTTLAAIIFWVGAVAIVYAQVGYPFVLRALVTGRRGREAMGGPRAPRSLGAGAPPEERPVVSLIVPAYDEEEVIADKVADALRLDWPRERLQIIVASDGSTDATAERARAAGV
jgi:cellulose synthase/poly-beta-1,6-N-acetylglucosamine synthase-like glycosyltransferase